MTRLPAPKKVQITAWSTLADRDPTYALVAGVDLVIVRWEDQVSVLYGRCLHRGALMSDGHIQGDDLICGVHQWDYRFRTGVSAYANDEALRRFSAWIDLEADAVLVDETEIAAWAAEHPQPFDRDAYQGLYADTHADPAEPHN